MTTTVSTPTSSSSTASKTPAKPTGTLAVPTKAPTDPFQARQVKNADIALYKVLNDSDVQQALTSQSSQYLPPTLDQVMSVLWAQLDQSGARSLTKKDVEKGVQDSGGSTSQADALWKQLDPKNSGSVSAGNFVVNSYLSTAVNANLKTVQNSVATLRQQAIASPVPQESVLSLVAPTRSTGTLLDYLT